MADETTMPVDEYEGQTPALVINCAPLLTQVIEVVGRDGRTYRLRDDVPTERLQWGFHLMDISERAQAAQTWEEREAALDERDQERLNLVTTIARHSYPGMSRAAVAEAFTAAQMEELLGYFFTTRLLPLLEQRIASALAAKAAQEQEQEESAAPAVAVEADPPAVATAGTTRSRRR